MVFDPKQLQLLLETFVTELDEESQAITHNLLLLEKKDLPAEEEKKIIEAIFRSAHNIKGTSRSLGIATVGDVAHRIESLFSSIQKKTLKINSVNMDVCFEAIDKMQLAMQAFIEKKPLTFDLQEFLQRLEANNSDSTVVEPPVKKNDIKAVAPQHSFHETSHDSIRVSVDKIDKISSLLEDIHVNKIAIGYQLGELISLLNLTNQFSDAWQKMLISIQGQHDKDSKDNLLKAYNAGNDYFINIQNTIQDMHKIMHICTTELNMLSHSLQEEVRTLRLVPINNLLGTFPRYIRDLSHDLNKRVALTIQGGDVKVDKLVLEGIKDPIMHLIRNAIDHGIEDVDVRRAKGKPEEGHIIIDIKEEGTQITINISDDGAGIDSKKILETAKNKNIELPTEADEMQILELIFQPGFSTKNKVTDLSGRGVGLDVVKENISHLNGYATVSTEPNKGTLFSLHVPLSIANESGLLIDSCKQQFVISTASIERVMHIPVNKILNVQGSQAIIFEDQTVVLRTLADILNLEKTPAVFMETIPLVILKEGKQIVALVVDEVIGERDIIIKPLPEPLPEIPCIAGGTLLESNQIIIVLNANDIIKASLHANNTRRLVIESDKKLSRPKPHILVVDDSITTRTLEKNILENKNYQVTVAVNGQEAWEILQKQKFSLLITDVMMPVMDGFTLTENVKKSKTLKNLPVIIVTSLGNDAEKKRGIEVGADAYIIKNEFESGALLEVVSQLV